jgi:hypothetical protein
MLGNIVAMIQFAVAVFLAAIGINLLISIGSYLMSKMIRVNNKERELRARLARYARLVTGLNDRVESRKGMAAGAASHLFGAQRQEKQMRSRLRELENAPYRFVRMIGAEQFPNKPFEFLVINSSVSNQVKRGEKHPFYDSSWARPCPVHVWSKGAEDAKAELERVYPKASAFKIVFSQALKGPAGSEQTSEGGEAAVAMAAAEAEA